MPNNFLIGDGSMSLAGLTAGQVTRGNTAALKGADPIAGFGWELPNSAVPVSAAVYFKAARAMTLNYIDIDLVYSIRSTPSGGAWSESLCWGTVSRGKAPTFPFGGPESADFGTVDFWNPDNIPAGSYGYDGYLHQDEFYSVILKSWIPTDGTASATSRHVTSPISLNINSGDYLVFQMAPASYGGDFEMQVLLAYT